MTMNKQDQEIKKLFYSMLRIRKVEEAIAKRYQEQKMRCPVHLCVGQEAIAVGMGAALAKDDVVFSSHRAHAHYLAKGGDLNRMMAELHCRAAGCCGGRGGSMHLIDLDAGFWGSTPIVGSTVPVAMGAAWAAQMQKLNRVVACFIGDGCFEEGVVHESLNFAALKNLSLIFICENNDFSVYTKLKDRQPNRSIHSIAKAHGWNVFSGDGNNIEEVVRRSEEAVYAARQNKGPQFLEFKTYRWLEHCGPNDDDHLQYRSRSEIDEGKNGCPIKRLEEKLSAKDLLSKTDLDQMNKTIDLEVEASFEYALSSPFPDPETLFEFSEIKDLKCAAH
jgi:TPP-dependent pyruvate/acetoin dehydrogenase alpha subunit